MFRTLSHDEAMPEGTWIEVLISGCPNGCKIYRKKTVDGFTNQYVYAHNSNYGCRR